MEKKWYVKMQQQPRKLIRPKIKLRDADAKVNHSVILFHQRNDEMGNQWNQLVMLLV